MRTRFPTVGYGFSVAVMAAQRKARLHKGQAKSLELATTVDEVADAVARLLAPAGAVVGGPKADSEHFIRPLLVVEAAAAGLAEMLLPEVNHFVGEGGKGFNVGAVADVLRVHDA